VTVPPPGDPRPPHGYGGYGPPPGYQQPPAGLGHPPYPYGPQAGPVRPGLLWVWLSWGAFVVLAVVGTVIFVGGLASSVGDAAPTATFESGEDTIVQIDPADMPAIYATAASATDVHCAIFTRDTTTDGLSLTQPNGSVTVTLNGTRWEQVFRIGVPRPDRYRVTCEGEGARFGVGKDLPAGRFVGSVLLWIALPAIGFIAALTTTIVVLVKRSNARRRAYGF
jgi:hypothetical protein